MMSQLFSFLPGAAVLVAAVVFRVSQPDATVVSMAGDYGLVVYGAGLALACVFHRSRAFIALIAVASLDLLVVRDPDGIVLLQAAGALALALFAALGVARDRGIASRVGALQLLAAALWGAAAVGLFSWNDGVTGLDALPGANQLFVVVWPGYAKGTLAIAVAAMVAVLYGLYRYRGPLERSLVWSVAFLVIAMHPALGAPGSSLFLVAVGLTITLALVETSYVMAYRDELTGLLGRRALMQYLDGIGGTYTIAMVDVDHFKKFNDKHGHDVGDQVLQLVASRLASAPGGAKAYRYGGEEFTLLLPGRTREEAAPHLEQVRISIEEARFSLRSWKRPRKKPGQGGAQAKQKKSRPLSVTVSIGTADTTGKDPTPTSVLKKSDQALYRAKKKGRNQVSN